MDLLILVFSILGNLSLGLLVYFKNPKSTTNRLFFALTLSLFLMLTANYFSVGDHDPSTILTGIRFAMFFASAVSYFYLLFVLTFPKSTLQLQTRKFIILTALTLTTMLVDISAYTFTSIKLTDSGAQPTPGPGIILFAIVTVGSVIASIYTLIHKSRHSTGVEKTQFNFILLGTSVMFGLIITTVFIPVNVFQYSAFAPLLPVYTLAFVGATAYAIVRHRLLDVRVIVARTVAYVGVATVLFVFYILLSVLAATFFLATPFTVRQIAVLSIISIITGYTFQPLRILFTRLTDNIFYKNDYDSNLFLSSLTKVMAEAILIDDIAHKLLQKIISEMRITRGAFVLTDAGKIFVTEPQGYKEEPKFSEKDVFALQALDKNLIFEELEEGPSKDLMRKLNVTVVIPLKTQVDHVGLLFLGEKASGEIYSAKDIKVLEIFSPEAAISFENAKSVEKIRRFNITLKEQVERATHELKDANAQLKELDKLKDEFLSVASHDLRTPMTAIKGYLWMAINERAGKITNPDLKRYLDISYTSAERMIQLINDLLNVSRIKAGRMQMVFEGLDLKPLMDQIFAEIMSKAAEKKIILKYEADAGIPKVILDKQRFPEILQNLIGNAIKFTPEKGKITVTAKKSKEKGLVEIAVTDTGVGLSKEDSSKLFEKYGRIESSYTAAKTSGGTGLGLYITKNYVDMHGGKIWVESEVGKGTSFIFTLKIADDEELKKMNAAQKKETSPTIPQPGNSVAREATVTIGK
ncbi:MAG TPA: ATP-binding protein [Candidatus Saccharimonadales bacterium]|nr:ATP-binding protein [Candidatus Saccharimonadales bacterium]